MTADQSRRVDVEMDAAEAELAEKERQKELAKQKNIRPNKDTLTYRIRKVLGNKFDDDGKQTFHVAWEGYNSDDDATWEPREHFGNQDALAEEYLSTNPSVAMNKNANAKKASVETEQPNSDKEITDEQRLLQSHVQEKEEVLEQLQRSQRLRLF